MKYIAVIALLLIVAACAPEQVACTADAKICPDGTAVGRIAPNCEFAPCPQGHGNEPTVAPSVPDELAAPITTENVNYYESYTGYYAAPELAGNYPGIIMIHEWWGLNDHIRHQADVLASNGYRVLAVDLFGTTATTPEDAREQTSNVVQEEALQNMKAAATYLREQGSENLASIGWCFGGAQSLQLGLSNEDIDATIMYYGRVETDPSVLKSMDQPVLGIFGALDTGIPVGDVRRFEKGLQVANVENEIHVYDNVGHAFANPDNSGYGEEEAADAWEKTLLFLQENLK